MNHHFSIKQAKFYAAEIIVAFEFLHKRNIIYRYKFYEVIFSEFILNNSRDLKLENVLLDHQGHIRLTDFGLAKQLKPLLEKGTKTFCGTPEYVAPEIILGREYGASVDYWSLGILIYEMITGWPPFQASTHRVLYEKILSQNINLLDKKLSDSARDLLSRLLEKDIKNRICPSKIKSHPFFKSIDFTKLAKKELKPPFEPEVVSKVVNLNKELVRSRRCIKF